MISDAWHKIHGFKGTYWGGLLSTLLLLIFMMLITLPLHYLGSFAGIPYPMYFLAGVIIAYFWLPSAVGVLTLSIRYLTHSNVKPRNIFAYYQQMTMAKIFLITIGLLAIILLGFMIPSNTIKLFMIFTAFLLGFIWIICVLLIVDQNIAMFKAIGLSLKYFFQNFFTSVGIIILILALMIVSLLTLFITFIWIGPFINNIIASFYLNHCRILK